MHFVGIAALIVAMGVTWITTPWVIVLAHRFGALDLPGARKIHSRPVPRVGGLAVFLGFAGGLGFAAAATGNLNSAAVVSVYWSGLALAATFMLAVGLVDDIWGLAFQSKFAAQALASVFVWACGFRIDVLSNPLGGELRLGWLSLPLTVLWIVAITNAVNLIDGLDGLATGIALIASLSVGAIALVREELGVTAASVALAGSLMGFLRYNFAPARIFLGDSGSMFLGFILAVTAVRGSQKGPTAVAILVPLMVLGLPVLDTSLAVARRLYRLGRHGSAPGGRVLYVLRNVRQVFLPDRAHIHHRLLDLGWSQRRAVLVLYGAGTLFAASAFALVLFNSARIAVVLLAFLALLVVAFYGVLYVRVRTASAGADPSARRRAREILASHTEDGASAG